MSLMGAPKPGMIKPQQTTGEKVRAKYILIATGSAPNHGAAIPGGRTTDVWLTGPVAVPA